MKRTVCLLIILALASCGLFSCASTQSTTEATSRVNSSPQKLWVEHDHVGPVDDREIVCWGDSLTEGVGAGEARIMRGGREYDISYLSYPDVLESLTGLKTFNFGLAGATSKEIAYMQGGLDLEVEENRSVVDEIELDPLSENEPEPLGDNEPETVDENEPEAVDAIWLKTFYEDLKKLKDLGEEHKGDILVIEMGSNGGWEDYDELIGQYWDMINHADTPNYIIIGDTDDPDTSADPDQEPFEPGEGPGETDWEAALSEEFGEHFINMRTWLIEHGLAAVGLEESEQDRSDAERGWISMQLRDDITHLNSYGYCAQAIAVYEKGRELKYWF